eukprot:2346635-Pleurochrysis_carterae.AAC.1
MHARARTHDVDHTRAGVRACAQVQKKQNAHRNHAKRRADDRSHVHHCAQPQAQIESTRARLRMHAPL